MISALLCVKNESHNMANCLKTLTFADEVVVIDDFSTDDTALIAKDFGAKVFQRQMEGDWSSQRNFGIQQCTNDWIFVIDADERVSQKLASEIQEKVGSQLCCYQVQRENCFHFNRATHGILRPDWVTRLFPKSECHYEGLVHEKLVSALSVERMSKSGKLFHYTYDNWDAYFGKFNRYTELMARQQYQQGKRANFWFDIVIRPWIAFFKMYILKRGFLDGKLGFILSVNHFFYTMTKYVRLYYLERNNGKL